MMLIQINYFRDGRFVPSKSLADFVCRNFTILNFVEIDIVALSLPVKISATNVLLRCGPGSNFNSVNHLDFVNHQKKNHLDLLNVCEYFLSTNGDCQEILSVKKELLVWF